MKKALFFLLSISFFHLLLPAQDYHPFPDSFARWSHEHIHYWDGEYLVTLLIPLHRND